MKISNYPIDDAEKLILEPPRISVINLRGMPKKLFVDSKYLYKLDTIMTLDSYIISNKLVNIRLK